MGGKGGAPPAPDYLGAARTEGAANRDLLTAQTFANRPSQITPWGSSYWAPILATDPATGRAVTRWQQDVVVPRNVQEGLEAAQEVERYRNLVAENRIRKGGEQFATPFSDWEFLSPETPTSWFSGGPGQLGPEHLRPLSFGQLRTEGAATGGFQPEQLFAYRQNPNVPSETFGREQLVAGRENPVTVGGQFGPETMAQARLSYQTPGGGLRPETWQGLTPAQVTPFGWRGLTPNQVQAGRLGALNPNQVQAAQLAQMGNTGVRQEDWSSLDPNAVRGAGFQTLDPNALATAGEARSRAEEAVYNRAASRLDPQFEQTEEALQSRLWNQGLRPGDEAWDAAIGNFNRQRTDAYQAAMNEAIMAGGAEAQRDFEMDLQRRQQAMGEEAQAQQMEMARRGMAAGEYGAGFQRELQRRQQLAAEAGQTFQEQLARRALTGEEAAQAFQEELARRQQAEAEFGAGFGRTLAQRQLAGEEAQDLFARDLARRETGVGEAERAFELDLAGRGQYAAEEQDLFARELARRQQQLAEAESEFGMGLRGRELFGRQVGEIADRELAQRQQRMAEAGMEFEQGITGKQAYGQELRDIYSRELGRRQQLEAERQAEFTREVARRGAEQSYASDIFNRNLSRQQQQVAEAESRFNMATTQRQQALAEQLQLRGLNLNEISLILGGQQMGMPTMPSYTPAGRGQAPQFLNAANLQYQAGLNAYNAQQAQQQGMWSGLMGAAATAAPYAFMYSDRRLKSDIKRVGTTPGGQPLYAYTIFGEPQIGVMADESPPHAVWRHPSGFLMVDYSRIR